MRSSPLKCRRSVLRRLTPRNPHHSYYTIDVDAPSSYDYMASTAVTELDLSNPCHPGSIADKINVVPGLKTSTAFFGFLRANLVLPSSAMSSNVSTPNLGPQQTGAPVGPSALATHPPAVPSDDDIPPLYIGVLDTHDDKVDALKLVADSVAQQRQLASLALVFNPLCLAALAAGLAAAYQFAWVKRQQDMGLTLSMLSGVVMIYLLAIRYAAGPYIRLAEQIKWDWLVSDEGEEDTVIGTRFGDDVIGALVLRLEPPSGQVGKKKNRNLSLKGGRGVIRGWTTRLKYRGKGVGTDMLHEAIRITREKCGKDAEVGFAQEHANSTMVLPEFFNRPFRKREQRAAKALDQALFEWEGAKRKR